MTTEPMNAEHISDAYRRLMGGAKPYIRRTPLLPIQLDAGQHIALKLEYLQVSGTFKARGAFNTLLSADVPRAGVIAASGGNHGLAVAHAARALGHAVTIVVPQTAPAFKLQALRQTGAEVVQHGDNYAQAFAAMQALQARTGAMTIHAYDQPSVLAGQGTCALELELQLQGQAPDTVLVATGGGGLIGGIATWFAGRSKVVAVETSGCATLHSALAAGQPTQITPSGIAADSLGASQIGQLCWQAACNGWISQAVLVQDTDVKAAQRYLWHTLRTVAEPGGATALAALLSGAYVPQPDERVAVILCGANCDPSTFLD